MAIVQDSLYVVGGGSSYPSMMAPQSASMYGMDGLQVCFVYTRLKSVWDLKVLFWLKF